MSLVALDVSAQNSVSPAGLGEAVDDDGHLQFSAKVLVEDGKLFANIVMFHNSVDENPVCDKLKVTFMESQLSACKFSMG